MVTIQAFWESTGKPVKGSKVSIGNESFFSGVTEGKFTDFNGKAHFNSNPGACPVYVDGRRKNIVIKTQV